jgi:hypothetical protein
LMPKKWKKLHFVMTLMGRCVLDICKIRNYFMIAK